MSSERIRRPAVAGMFYPGNPATLEREVAVFLESAQPEQGAKEIYGLVAPHAGYMYSGGVAARAYRQVMDRHYDVVVVISPSHHVYFEKVSVYNGDYYETPLGLIPVDKELSLLLAETDPQIIYSSIGHEGQEHALEVQLPFLQHVLDDFRLIPVVMGNQNYDNILALSDALTKVLSGQNALIVASSDLSHYHPYDVAVRLDSIVIEHINNYVFHSFSCTINYFAHSCCICIIC